MINNVTLVGRTTKAIELKQNVNGTAYARFTLAVNRPTKDQNGNSQADFINCVVWSKQAENAAKYVGKGAQIGVEGRIQTTTYDDNNGVRQYMTEVVVNKITFLESKRSQLPEPQEPSYLNQTQEAGVNHVDPHNNGYPTSYNHDFSNPNFNPNVGNPNNPFQTATAMVGQSNKPLITINDDDLPF